MFAIENQGAWIKAGAAITDHDSGFGEALEEGAPRGLRFSGTPLVSNHFAAASGGEDTPPGSEVEPINLDDVVDLAGDLDAGTYLPAPADLMPKGTSGSTWFDVCLGLLPEEPIKEPLQGEESAAVVTLTCRGGATFWAFPSLVPGSVAAVLYQSCIA